MHTAPIIANASVPARDEMHANVLHALQRGEDRLTRRAEDELDIEALRVMREAIRLLSR